MKRILLCAAVMATFASMNAQTYNFFDPRDCDSDGWLWFDSQAKLDKYCGDWGDYKIILSGAQYEDSEGQYRDCELDPTIFGYNTKGYQYVTDADGNEIEPLERAAGTWTGAIITPQAKSYGAQNGGGIILHLPDLAEFSVAMSSENRLRQMVLMGSKETGEVERIDLGIVTGYAFPFTSMTDLCQYTWANLQTKMNQNTGLTLASPKGVPVTAGLFNDMSTDVLIQGVKVFTYTQTEYPPFDDSAVNEISADDANAPVEYFNLQGMKVTNPESGIFVRRQGSKTSKVVIK